jgi:hypothetical protein
MSSKGTEVVVSCLNENIPIQQKELLLV